MKEKRYTLKGGMGTLPPLLEIPAFFEAGAAELRVLLALNELQDATAARIAEVLAMAQEEVSDALGFWRGAGVVLTADAAPADAAASPARKAPLPEEPSRELGAAELADYIRDAALAGLIEAAEQQCGRVLNRPDLAALIRLSQDLALDGGYILTLLSYCDTLGGDGAKSIRYAERVATSLVAKGINDLEALENYIRERAALRSAEGWLRRMFGMGTRRLTEREQEAFLTWTRTFGYGEDVIGAAYDITVEATGKASVAYTAKILTRWHEAGVRTADEAAAFCERERAEKHAPKPRTPKTTKPAGAGSFEVGDFFRRALDRSYKTDTTDADGTAK